VASYKELARKTRLMLEKLVKTRKETIRVEIQQAGKDKAAAHITALNTRLGKPYMPAIPVDFAGVMKGKKTVASLRDAVDTELARFKIEANAVADRIQINLGTLRELAGAHAFLFADTGSIVLKAADDLTALVKMRIAEHQQAEAAKAEALRAQIAEEERANAEKVVADAERARVAAETKRQLDEQAASVAAANKARSEADARARQDAVERMQKQPADVGQVVDADFQEVAAVTQIESARPAPTIIPLLPSLRLGQINERLAPVSLTADGLARLGFAPAATDKSAKLYHETDFPAMCAALIRHIGAAAQAKAA
jgi:multidrug efflux pump subunit AcrA (membrane-fusion protein)